MRSFPDSAHLSLIENREMVTLDMSTGSYSSHHHFLSFLFFLYVLVTMLAWEEEDVSDMPESSPLFGKDVIKRIKLCEREWEEEYLQPQGEATEETYLTSSKKPITCLYSPADTEQFDYLRDLGFPGTEPFTRGIHPTIYRGRPFVSHSL